MMLFNKNLQVKNEILSSTTNSTAFILEISLLQIMPPSYAMLIDNYSVNFNYWSASDFL